MTYSNVEVFNFKGAFRGMRNPLDSHERADSYFGICGLSDVVPEPDEVCEAWKKVASIIPGDEVEDWIYTQGCRYDERGNAHYNFIGPEDMKLAQRLLKGGSEHSKFMRQILVSVDISATRFFWSEFDTYHFNSKNSESTMHRLLNKHTPISRDQFVIKEGTEVSIDFAIDQLNKIREAYLNETNTLIKNQLLEKAKLILPESFIQKRTVVTNYAELRNMYFQRKNHRLPEWREDFVQFIESLPWAEELICYDGK